MKIERRYTVEGQDAYASIDFRKAVSEIKNPDGSTVFRLDGIEVPADWSQVATDILAQKYFRKAGVPVSLKRVEENSVPSWLWRSVADDSADGKTTGERSAKQVFNRLAGTWTYWGWKGGYFTTEADARAFYDEHCFMLARQMCAPNSPQWFNTGLHWAYGIDGPMELENEPIQFELVGEVWAQTTREALLRGDHLRVLELVSTVEQSRHPRDRRSFMDVYAPLAVDRHVVAEIVHRDTPQDGPTPFLLLSPFGETAVDVLFAELSEEPDRGRRAALLGVLRQLAPGRSEPVVRRLDDTRWYVVRNAVNVLRYSRHPRSLDLMAEAAKHAAEAVRREAVFGLAAGGTAAVPYLGALAAGPDASVRILAIEALRGLAAPESATALVVVVSRRGDLKTRRSALEALAEHPSPEASSALARSRYAGRHALACRAPCASERRPWSAHPREVCGEPGVAGRDRPRRGVPARPLLRHADVRPLSGWPSGSARTRGPARGSGRPAPRGNGLRPGPVPLTPPVLHRPDDARVGVAHAAPTRVRVRTCRDRVVRTATHGRRAGPRRVRPRVDR